MDESTGHIAYVGFGHQVRDPLKHIVDLVDVIRKATGKAAKALNGYDREMLLRQEYEKAFGLFNHDHDDTDPPGYALVAQRPSEDVDEHGLMFNEIRRYHLRQVYKEFGLSLTDFLSLPKDRIDFIYRVLDEHALRTQSVVENVKNTVAASEGLPPLL